MDESVPSPEPVDPRTDEDYLPAWLWLTLCIICLICLLFISFRRAKSLELYQRARDHLLNKLPFSLRRGIRLSDSDISSDPYSYSSLPTHSRRQPIEGDLADDDDDDASDTSSVRSSPLRVFRNDASPAVTAPLRSYSIVTTGRTRRLANEAKEQVQRGMGNVLETLGWGNKASNAGGRSAGIAQAFRGRGNPDRTGRIRLEAGAGGELDEEQEVGGPGVRHSELSGVGGAISRIFDVAGGQRPSSTRASSAARSGSGSGHHRASSASSVSSGAALFDVGDDADAGDAVELPTHFSLGTPSSGGASGANGSSASIAPSQQ
ncbi:hypothetical protein JCM11251_004530 [Rhodosporidiobolus azoricus]